MTTKLDASRKRDILERMLVIRRFEEGLVELWQAKAFRSHYHLYIGQEATAAAVMECLRPDDRMATTHRNHGHVLARGADPGRAFAEILGRETGLNGGRAGTLHMSAPALGFLHTSALVGGSTGLAVGAGYALKQAGEGAVSVAFFGDASLEEGITFEAMNIAALWSLPVVFMCENNGAGAIGSKDGGFPASEIAATELTSIPATLGIPAAVVDGRDVQAVYDAVGGAVEKCRDSGGPSFIEAVTTRWAGSAPMWPELPAGTTEIGRAWDSDNLPAAHADWFENQDPILVFARDLASAGELSQDDITHLDGEVTARIDAARQMAVDSAMPAPDSALTGTLILGGPAQ